MNGESLTVKAVAQALKVSPATVYRALQDGHLTGWHLAPHHRWFISEAALETAIQGLDGERMAFCSVSASLAPASPGR